MDLNFDATNVSPSTAFDPLPPGWYPCQITKAEIVVSQTAGEMLKIEHRVMDQHDHAGRVVYNYLCINHPTSKKTQDIARSKLSAICHSIGKLQIGPVDDLLGAELLVKLKTKPATDKYDAGNDVVDYKPLSGETTSVPAAKPVAAPQAAPAATRAPWKK